MIIKIERTDWISGLGPLNACDVGAKPKAVLSTYTEKVLLAFIQIWHHQRLSSAGRVYLEEQGQRQIHGSKTVYSLMCVILQAVPWSMLFPLLFSFQ